MTRITRTVRALAARCAAHAFAYAVFFAFAAPFHAARARRCARARSRVRAHIFSRAPYAWLFLSFRALSFSRCRWFFLRALPFHAALPHHPVRVHSTYRDRRYTCRLPTAHCAHIYLHASFPLSPPSFAQRRASRAHINIYLFCHRAPRAHYAPRHLFCSARTALRAALPSHIALRSHKIKGVA